MTLPPAMYSSPEIYAAEVGAIFEKEWVCLGRIEEISHPGDYFTVDLVGDPLLVVRGEDGRVRALSNVCSSIRSRGRLYPRRTVSSELRRCRLRRFG